MDDFEIKLKILSDGLDKKADSLNQILNITENQRTILEGEHTAEAMTFFKEMNSEKQNLIDLVLCCDEVFETIFKEINSCFDEKAPAYKPLISVLQEKIELVTDLDVKIRLQESNNRELTVKIQQTPKINVPKASKNYMMKQYENNKRKK